MKRYKALIKKLKNDKSEQAIRELQNEFEKVIEVATQQAHPADLFALTSYLLEISGAFGYYGYNCDEQCCYKIENRNELSKIGQDWSKQDFYEIPKSVIDKWKEFTKFWNHKVKVKHDNQNQSSEAIAPWVFVAHELMIIADEACAQISRKVPDQGAQNYNCFQEEFTYLLAEASVLDRPGAENQENSENIFDGIHTICRLADKNIVCVLPKTRVAQVGCNHRSFSNHLSLLQTHRKLSIGYQKLYAANLIPDEEPLNLLLIPYPFQIFATDFEEWKPDKKRINERFFGEFKLVQNWLKSKDQRMEIIHLTLALIKEAEKDIGKINGLIFPEYALNWSTYNRMSKILVEEFENLEFFIAGSSDNCDGEKANIVSNRLYGYEDEKNIISPHEFINSRRKHHRWCLDKNQISNYHLGAVLNPKMDWWERHSIADRKLTISNFRENSTYVPMICEDLARMDPCHELLRSLGPNLVFALLLDGPQLASRWGARYAHTLADDPECSVLSLSSKALINRQNKSTSFSPSHAIGLWKDDTGKTVEVNCPDCASGVVITLTATKTKNYSVCKRVKKDCISWHFVSQHPIELAGSEGALANKIINRSN